MKNFILLLFLSIFCYSAFGQRKNRIDSLSNLLENSVDKKQTVDLYNAIAKEYRHADSVSTALFTQKAIALAIEINYPEGSIDAYFHIAWATTKKRAYKLAIELFTLVLEKSKEVNYEIGKVYGLNGLGITHFDIGKYDESLDYAIEALGISQQINFQYGLAMSYNQLGIIYVQRGNTSQALEYFAKATALEEDSGDIIELDIYNRKGIAYAMQGDYNRSLDAFFKSLRIEEQSENITGLAGSYNNIGVLFYRMKNYEKALEYYQRALKIFSQVDDKRGISTLQNNIAVIYEETQSYDSAKLYFQEAIKVAESIDFKHILGWSYDGMSKVSQAFGEFQEGETWGMKALTIRRSLGRNTDLAQTHNTLGNNYYLKDDFREGLKNFKEASKICIEIGNPINHRDALLGISKCHHSLGNYKTAHENYILYKQLDDSVRNKENVQQLTRLEAEYEFQQERDSVSFAQEREKIAYEAIINQKTSEQRKLYIGFSLIFILLIVTLYLFYSSLKSNKKLNLLNGEIKNQNLQIKDQRDSLRKLNTAKTRFFSIISHDLRGPIANLIGYSELIKMQMTDFASSHDISELETMYAHMQDASKRLLHLLDGLLKWALKEEGMIPYQPEALNLKDCANTSLEIHSLHALSKNIKLTDELSADIQVWADKNSLLTILRNLIGNAVKFTNKNGEVKIYSKDEADSEWLNLYVQDNGVGMSKENLEKVFQLRENIVSAGTSGEQGTGLGLNMVNDFVKLNGAKIEVESQPGEGTTFIISLPKKVLEAANIASQ